MGNKMKMTEQEKKEFYSHYAGWATTTVDIIIHAVERDRASRSSVVDAEAIVKSCIREAQRIADKTGKKRHVLTKVFTAQPTPPAVPVSPFGCGCWTIGDHSKVGAEGKWQRSLGNNICCTIRHDAKFCEVCGHAIVEGKGK